MDHVSSCKTEATKQESTATAANSVDAKGVLTQNTLLALLQKQRDSFMHDGFPNSEIRQDRVMRIADIHRTYADKICEALNEDFKGRSTSLTQMSDIGSVVMDAKDTIKHISKWMKPRRRKSPFPLELFGAKAQILYQPLGVIGNISPWNFPMVLAFGPAIGALAAGNRMLIKPSELTPCTSELMKEMVESAFDETELAVVNGGVEVGKAFSALPFDHLVYTGGPTIAKYVMKSAAENLVPLTLELGGKCPVIISDTADLKMATDRIISAKAVNSGQLCLSPDYILISENRIEEFLSEAQSVLKRFYGDSLLNNKDYTSVINRQHWIRLKSYIDEAKKAGCRVKSFNPLQEDFSSADRHRLPITFFVNPDDNLKAMQEEFFGPLLSIKPMNDIQHAINYVNARPRPLALYYFGNSKTEMDRIKKETTSGGMTINDVAMHASCPDLPLSGVGNSGMGAYHGQDGFREFSHAKAIYKQAVFSPSKLLQPPYGKAKKKIIESIAN